MEESAGVTSAQSAATSVSESRAEEETILVSASEPVTVDGGRLLVCRSPGPEGFYKVPLGLKVALPTGYAMLVAQRGGGRTTNGIVDAGFRGEVQAIVAPGRPRAQFYCTPLRLAPGIATDVPFFEVFAPKRDEDAGYDIPCPRELVLPPGGAETVALPVHRTDGRHWAYVFGRSSLNLRGIVVFPTPWESGPCRFRIQNRGAHPVTLESGQRVAQLVLTREPLSWITGRSPFPATPRTPMQHRPAWLFTRDFVAPSSARGTRGFGSTGL
ncbi:dUTPase [Suid alphaherpesvirus 1]|uniref:dUTPase n=1 Tax=Suid herpesvirus 1 TaxID=10345 RepID=A0A0H4MJZ3_SUHV|nr:dUTPase [Suid alphaherpesvirus 1]